MPTAYAHKKFGARVLSILPKDIRVLIHNNLPEYLVGLHGPDILFFYRPGTDNDVMKLGKKCHHEAFSIMFEKAVKILKDDYSDEKLVYFLGVMTHYYLDRALHPIIGESQDKLGLSHGKIETEFDRFLLIKDGKKPVGYKSVAHLPVFTGVAQSAAAFYDITAGEFFEALATAKAVNLMCETDSDTVRKGLCRIMDASGNTEKVASLIMSRQQSDKVQSTLKQMNKIFENEICVCAMELAAFARAYDDCDIPQTYGKDFLGK